MGPIFFWDLSAFFFWDSRNPKKKMGAGILPAFPVLGEKPVICGRCAHLQKLPGPRAPSTIRRSWPLRRFARFPKSRTLPAQLTKQNGVISVKAMVLLCFRGIGHFWCRNFFSPRPISIKNFFLILPFFFVFFAIFYKIANFPFFGKNEAACTPPWQRVYDPAAGTRCYWGL